MIPRASAASRCEKAVFPGACEHPQWGQLGERQDERKVQAPKGDPPLIDIQRSASARPLATTSCVGSSGTRAAREMCLTGRSCDAQEALTIGLINRAVEPGELLAAARAAREIAAIPEEMLENAKRGFVAHQPLPFES